MGQIFVRLNFRCRKILFQSLTKISTQRSIRCVTAFVILLCSVELVLIICVLAKHCSIVSCYEFPCLLHLA